MSRLVGLVVGLIVAVFGFFCLNFTSGFGIEHHTEWAKAHRMPEPSLTIFWAGAALLAFGGGIVGYSLRGNRTKAAP